MCIVSVGFEVKFSRFILVPGLPFNHYTYWQSKHLMHTSKLVRSLTSVSALLCFSPEAETEHENTGRCVLEEKRSLVVISTITNIVFALFDSAIANIMLVS
jgi:hypothetical protein